MCFCHMFLLMVTCYYLHRCTCLSHVPFPRVTCYCHVSFPRIMCKSGNHLTIGGFRGGFHSPWSWQRRMCMSLALPSSNWSHVGRGRCHELRSQQSQYFEKWPHVPQSLQVLLSTQVYHPMSHPVRARLLLPEEPSPGSVSSDERGMGIGLHSSRPTLAPGARCS